MKKHRQSGTLKNQIPPAPLLESKRKPLVLGVRGHGRRVVDVVGLLVLGADDDGPVALEELLQFDFDVFHICR